MICTSAIKNATGKANSSSLTYEAMAQVRTQTVWVSIQHSLLSANITAKKRWFKNKRVWPNIASSTRQNQGWSSSLDTVLIKLYEKTANTPQISLVLHDSHHLQLRVAEGNALTASEPLCNPAVHHTGLRPSPGTWTLTFPPRTKLGIISELFLVKST